MESITQERERDIRPPTEVAEKKSHSSNSLMEQRKPEQREKLRRKKCATAQQK